MNRFLKILSFWVIFITLPCIILFTSVELVGFDRDFYRDKYDKHNVVENTGIEKNELMDITEEMLQYLRGNRQDLEVYGEVQGENRLIFDQRDQAHMVDVQELFLKGFALRNVFVALFAIAFLYMVMIKKHRVQAAKAVFLSNILFIGIILILGGIISTDFSKYFDTFHYIFFDNDLWRLDPSKSILINLVPLGFFIDIAIKIGLYFFGSLGVCIFLSGYYLKKSKKRKNKNELFYR